MEPWQHHFFRQRNTEWLSVTNPTQCDSHTGHSLHLDRPRLRRPCTLFSGARVGWAHFIAERDLSWQDRARAKEKHDLSSKALSFSKERMRKRDRERVCVRASMTGESSPRMLQLATLHRGAKPAFTIFYRAGAKELENAIYSPQVFLLRKKDVERASMTGESSRKNLNILQASASKLSGFTPRIQPSACGLGLYNARCKTR